MALELMRSQGRAPVRDGDAFGASARGFWAKLAGLFGRREPAQPDPLAIARKLRWQAAEDYADARKVGDTRAQHHAHKAFRAATAEVVRLELAERRS